VQSVRQGITFCRPMSVMKRRTLPRQRLESALLSMGSVTHLPSGGSRAAKALSPSIEAAVIAAKAPPGSWALQSRCWYCCPRAGPPCVPLPRNRVQTSINLALGSALASIGLTIPAVAAVSVLLGCPRPWTTRQGGHPPRADLDRSHADARRGPCGRCCKAPCTWLFLPCSYF